MRKLLIGVMAAAAATTTLLSAPAAHADPCTAQGLITAIADSSGPSPICVRPGHIPGGYIDATGGNPWGGMNVAGPPPGFPCSSSDAHVTKVDPQTGNAIEVFGPPGCNDLLPMSNN